MANLVGEILEQCNRLREEILPEYDKIPEGVFAATLMRASIRRAERAVASGDAVECVQALKDLREYKL